MSKELSGGGWPWGMALGERRPGRAFPIAFALGSKGRFFGTGELRLALLSLLSEGPKHGYQLMKELAERSGGVYRASAGSVYPTLQQLEDETLIRVKQQGGRKVHSLTAAGRRELERDPEGVRRIWERAEECGDWGHSMGPESMMVIPMLSPLVKASLQAAGRGGASRVRDILDRARKDLEAI
jgi:DNA-binding PadR family transcriptional regulator